MSLFILFFLGDGQILELIYKIFIDCVKIRKLRNNYPSTKQADLSRRGLLRSFPTLTQAQKARKVAKRKKKKGV